MVGIDIWEKGRDEMGEADFVCGQTFLTSQDGVKDKTPEVKYYVIPIYKVCGIFLPPSFHNYDSIL